MRDGKKQFDENLRKLIEQSRNAEIRALLGSSNPNDLIDSTGTTLLHLSARYNNHLLTKYLIKRGINIDARDKCGSTSILTSAMFNSFKSAAVLLDANADVCAINESGRSALQSFLNGKRKVPAEIVNRCLERVRISSDSNDEVANILVNAGCSLDLVVRMCNSEVTKLVLERNCFDEDDDKLSTALYLAMKILDLENVKVILERVTRVSICKTELLEFIANVLTKKATKKGLQIVDCLLGKVSDWQSLDEQVILCLESIVENGSKDSVRILLEHDVDKRVRSVFGERELLAHLFANQYENIIELLQERSFNVNCRGKSGNTPLKLAVKNRVVRNVQLLLDMTANPNIADDDGWVPLFEALSPKKVEMDDKKCVELLLQYGAEVQVIDNSGQTIVDWALVNGDLTLLEPVIAHLAILETLGQTIMPKIRQQINVCRHLKVCYETYRKQLDRMKQHEICADITLFTVLTDDSEKIAPLARNQKNIARLMQSNAVRKFHWYYVSTLKKRFEQAAEILVLRNKAALTVSECIERFDEKNVVVEKIIGYLNYGDLYMFA